MSATLESSALIYREMVERLVVAIEERVYFAGCSVREHETHGKKIRIEAPPEWVMRLAVEGRRSLDRYEYMRSPRGAAGA